MLLITDREEEHARKHNVVLFPKTYQYYQVELTRLLESERYAEAAELLEFLLQFDGEEEDTRSEWSALYDWLQMVFPEIRNRSEAQAQAQTTHMGPDETELEDESEEQLLQAQVAKKLQTDDQYVRRLMDSLKDITLDERKWLVLEQLANVDDEDLNDDLIFIMETEPLHPLIQFGLLQILKRRGATGAVTFWRAGEQIVVHIEHTPMDYASFPDRLRLPAQYVHDAASLREPSLAYFAEEMWQQFLRAIYGSVLYDQLQDNDNSDSNVWAAALHKLVAGFLHLEEEETEVKRMYAVGDEQRMRYDQALKELIKAR
ncbi:hypothetical protein [Paenibacillus marinisediminis]